MKVDQQHFHKYKQRNYKDERYFLLSLRIPSGVERRQFGYCYKNSMLLNSHYLN